MMFFYSYLINLGVPGLICKKFKNGLTHAPVIVNDLDLNFFVLIISKHQKVS